MQEKLFVRNFSEFSNMPEEYRELVIHQLRQHVEGELLGAYDYINIFLPLSPDVFEMKVCCERASEELDHFILGATVLKDIGFDADSMLKRPIGERKYYKTEGVEFVKNWLQRGLFSFIGEAVVLSIIEEMAFSSYVPIAEMTRPIIIDEHIHVAHGRRIVESIIDRQGVDVVQSEFETAWNMSLDLFGRSNSERSKKYVKWGLRRYSNEEARSRFIEKMLPEIKRLGLNVSGDDSKRKFL
mgnify:FL=1